MKRLILCGIAQHEPTTPPLQSTLPKESKTNPQTKMAAYTTNSNEWHTFNCGGHVFTVPIRYQDPRPVGEGAFGAVIRATDAETGKVVAIKKMLHPFQTTENAKRTYRELVLLMYLNHPDAQVVQLFNVFTPEKSLDQFQTLYFVFNYAGFTLHDAIRANKPFLETHVRLIIYLILRGLKFLHSAGIIHRDLKPQNIATDENTNVTSLFLIAAFRFTISLVVPNFIERIFNNFFREKFSIRDQAILTSDIQRKCILDFGLARIASDGIQTGYVSTRWWRAPEIYVNWERYNEKLDIWSVGCIMAELILLRAAFRGSDHIDHLNKIFNILGTPDLAVLHEICTAETANYIGGLPSRPKQNYNELFGFKYNAATEEPVSGVSPQGIDLLDRLLAFDHRQRPTAAEALDHPFFQALHDPKDEPTIHRFNDVHQDATYSIEKWKSLVWRIMEEFRPPEWMNNTTSEEDLEDAIETT